MTCIDWMIVGAYAALCAGCGWIARKRIKSMADFVVAGRRVKFHIGAASLIGTELGLVTVMAMSEEGFGKGFSAMTFALCFFAGVTFVGATGFIVNRLRQRRVMTIPEFYGQRYSPGVRWLAGVVLASAGILNMGVFLKVGGVFFAHVTGLGQEGVAGVMAVLLVLVLIYTLLGGMVTVILTDYLQFILLVLGCLIATIYSLHYAGFSNMVEVVTAEYGPSGFSPFTHEGMGWPFIVLNLLVFLAVPTVWQPSVSRMLSTEDPKLASKITLWSGLTFMGRGTIPILWGIAALTCIKTGRLEVGDGFEPIAAMPMLFVKILPAGILGLFVAGMFGAFMSTHDSYLMAWSSILTQDVVAPLFRGQLSEKVRLLINRVCIVLIGGFLLWWGLFFEPGDTILQYQQITGAIYLSGALSCVMFGLYWKRANAAGAYAATIVGVAFPVVNVLLSGSIDDLPEMFHFLKNGWKAGAFAFALAATAMIVVSWITAPWAGHGTSTPAGGETADRRPD